MHSSSYMNHSLLYHTKLDEEALKNSAGLPLLPIGIIYPADTCAIELFHADGCQKWSLGTATEGYMFLIERYVKIQMLSELT